MASETRDVASPVSLRDGTLLSDLMDPVERTVSLRTLVDDEIFDLEMERIFGRCWIAVAHESEIPEPGDFVSGRTVGQDPVVVTRDADGEIHVLLNVCAHRGMTVCREDRGRASRFRCAYHGWVFDNRGDFVGAPLRKERYGDQLDAKRNGLDRARVGVHAGMVFATFDPDAPSLAEYLGPYAFYLDLFFGRYDAGSAVLGPPQRWVVNANWKLPAEQFSGDGYHGMTLHSSLYQLGVAKRPSDTTPDIRYGVDLTVRGHGMRLTPDYGEMWSKLEAELGRPLSAVEKLDRLAAPELQRGGAVPPLTASSLEQIKRNLSEAQLQVLAHHSNSVGNVFPNLGHLGGMTWRTWNPRSPGRTDILSWAVGDAGASDEEKAARRRQKVFAFGSSGVYEQDDAEGWDGIQRSVAGIRGRRRHLHYGARYESPNPPGWFPADDTETAAYHGLTKDDCQWAFWCRWLECLEGRP